MVFIIAVIYSAGYDATMDVYEYAHYFHIGTALTSWRQIHNALFDVQSYRSRQGLW